MVEISTGSEPTIPVEPAPPTNRRRWLLVGAAAAVVVVIVLVIVLIVGGSSSSNGQPEVVLSPAPSSSPYPSQQQVTVSVGPNTRFAPYSRIEILECADPGGQTGNLPKNDDTCDGNTAPGFSVLVNKDGSFTAPNYQLWSLPNTQLGETYDGEPVCNATKMCVLYVGENQTDFTQPKVFSAPFTIHTIDVPKAPK